MAAVLCKCSTCRAGFFYVFIQSMVFPKLDDVLGAKFDTTSSEGKKKLKQTPNTFFITKGKLLAVECVCVGVGWGLGRMCLEFCFKMPH